MTKIILKLLTLWGDCTGSDEVGNSGGGDNGLCGEMPLLLMLLVVAGVVLVMMDVMALMQNDKILLTQDDKVLQCLSEGDSMTSVPCSDASLHALFGGTCAIMGEATMDTSRHGHVPEQRCSI